MLLTTTTWCLLLLGQDGRAALGGGLRLVRGPYRYVIATCYPYPHKDPVPAIPIPVSERANTMEYVCPHGLSISSILYRSLIKCVINR